MYNKYEAVFIIKINEEEKNIKETIEKINNIVKSEGGEILKKEDLGNRKLAYEVKGENQGRYYIINFKIPEDYEGKIKVKINTIDEVIKFIIVKMNDDE